MPRRHPGRPYKQSPGGLLRKEYGEFLSPESAERAMETFAALEPEEREAHRFRVGLLTGVAITEQLAELRKELKDGAEEGLALLEELFEEPPPEEPDDDAPVSPVFRADPLASTVTETATMPPEDRPDASARTTEEVPLVEAPPDEDSP